MAVDSPRESRCLIRGRRAIPSEIIGTELVGGTGYAIGFVGGSGTIWCCFSSEVIAFWEGTRRGERDLAGAFLFRGPSRPEMLCEMRDESRFRGGFLDCHRRESSSSEENPGKSSMVSFTGIGLLIAISIYVERTNRGVLVDASVVTFLPCHGMVCRDDGCSSSLEGFRRADRKSVV